MLVVGFGGAPGTSIPDVRGSLADIQTNVGAQVSSVQDSLPSVDQVQETVGKRAIEMQTTIKIPTTIPVESSTEFDLKGLLEDAKAP